MKIKTEAPPKVHLVKNFKNRIPHFGVGDNKKDKRVEKVYVAFERMYDNVYAVYTHFSSN